MLVILALTFSCHQGLKLTLPKGGSWKSTMLHFLNLHLILAWQVYGQSSNGWVDPHSAKTSWCYLHSLLSASLISLKLDNHKNHPWVLCSPIDLLPSIILLAWSLISLCLAREILMTCQWQHYLIKYSVQGILDNNHNLRKKFSNPTFVVWSSVVWFLSFLRDYLLKILHWHDIGLVMELHSYVLFSKLEHGTEWNHEGIGGDMFYLP